ncbi:hypothetical protein O8E88_000392 [Flavobacterium psychrophilum]|uniref:hypothetical protein n=1 Tax=Flavobacterium psychrophilum TaxID=96345 RepID=UPI0004F76393|nr:hypothetical protein [Flavobacterium psychrophilum]AIN74175.1 hypothetical protein FPG3_07595 [Flavobacterium psychrophilum FPG3]EKT2068611.1 hypothetical protein [Flavobacterium psychrophilum]EKT2070716.1 hypothetical protein [Flavobacterium psychrophilum]EKT4490225.1 hypothetical protein [Flavobacterium psychrophilum]MBF2043771.1 hypothetical protein [Flavobacterium psychrophilum]
MKKTVLAVIFLIHVFSLNAQVTNGIIGSANWFNNWTDFKPKTTEHSESTHILNGIIDANTTLYKKNTYLLLGVVYLANNAILTIEPGTVIRGDFATCGTLVITKGAKIIAEGVATDPIVFTSNKNVSERKPGDWGGIIMLGDAPINKFGGIGILDFNLNPKYNFYGGQNPESNSGILKYVRIEFSGRKLNALKELNGLSLAGVGSKTKIEYVQISFSNDDSFESYGGNVIFNNLISFRATDDDFDFTQGAQCNISNSIAIRYPFSSDVSRSRCFEVDSYDKLENYDLDRKLTKITANNITLINNEDNDQGLVKEAIYVKYDSFFELKNSVISGFNQFLLLENKAILNSNLNKLKFENLVLNNCKAKVELETNTPDKLLEEWIANDSFNIITSNTERKKIFEESDIKKNPDFRLKDNNSGTLVVK